jgi:hypothetical protein
MTADTRRALGCLRFHKRGVNACRNGLRIRQDALDQAVLDVLAGALDAGVIADAVEAAVAELRSHHAEAARRRTVVRQELEAIATWERRLLDAIVDGDVSAGPIRDRLRAELGRRDALTAELTALEAAPLDTDQLVQDVAARAADLRNLLGRNVAQARQVVRLVLEGRLVCQPFDDESGRGYAFTATGTYRKLGVKALESVNVGGGPNGTRSNLHNSTARFHCSLRGDPQAPGRLTAAAVPPSAAA